MGKTLKVCLAMGGGVSLGSFSGAALTEALKLLVLYGEDAEGIEYEKVVVDGMSGASAGAIALTIMLKCLTDYKGMMPLFDESLKESDLTSELADAYFDGAKAQAESHRHIEDLKALQLAQKIQNKLWTEEVDAVALYGKRASKNYKADINAGFSLLDRGLLERLTKRYLMYDKGIDPKRKRLLDKRVLFACSLTNLLPIEITSKYDKLKKLDENVLKSVGSQNHSELRVIDFVFDAEAIVKKPTDEKWLQFSDSPGDSDVQFNITSKEAWATISASALACGAFPIAFEPVLLKRFASEYGGDKGRFSNWPLPFRNLVSKIESLQEDHGEGFTDNVFIGKEKGNRLNYGCFHFPYIDGGTFNNEPIKEAYKIGTFQDFNEDVSNEERLILFVDPIVRQEEHHSFRVGAFKPIKEKDGIVVGQKETDKLIGSVSSIIGVLANQGSIKEEHKINDVRENLKLRDTIFPYLNHNENLGKNLTIDLLATAFNKIRKNLKSGIISLGTRNPLEYFLVEIQKGCEKTNPTSRCILINEVQLQAVKTEVEAQFKAFENGTIGKKDIKPIYHILNIETDNEAQNIFAQAVFKVIIDFALSTEGKRENAYRAAVLAHK